MRFRHFAHTLLLALAVSVSTPALAHGHKHDGDRDMRPDWREGRHSDGYGSDFDAAREDWLEDCRHRISNNGMGGAAIDRAEDRDRDRDVCESYLDDYYAHGPQGGYPGYGAYGYAVPMVMVPVMLPGKPCVETVTTTEYVTTRPARRYVPRPRPRPDKRIRVAPDKRIPLK